MSFQDRYGQSPDEDAQEYVYYYSNQRTAEVKSSDEVILFPSPISKEVIHKYRSGGFKAWGYGTLYEYKISVADNMTAFPFELNLVSTPDAFKYNRRHPIDQFFKGKGIDNRRAQEDEKYYNEIKDKYDPLYKEYSSTRDKYVKHNIAPMLTSRNYDTHPYIKSIKESFDYWTNFNFHRGNKNEIATYISHLLTPINKPLRPVSVQQIT